MYEGFDLLLFGDELKLDCVVMVDDFVCDGVVFLVFYGDDMLLLVGKMFVYFGYVVVILIYYDFVCFCVVKNVLKFCDDVICYGVVMGLFECDLWGIFCYVCVGGKMVYDDDVYLSLKDVLIFLSMMCKYLLVWLDGKEYGKFDE